MNCRLKYQLFDNSKEKITDTVLDVYDIMDSNEKINLNNMILLKLLDLKDKNKKEIIEGDFSLVKLSDSSFIVEIYSTRGKFSLRNRLGINETFITHTPIDIYHYFPDMVRIDGNILNKKDKEFLVKSMKSFSFEEIYLKVFNLTELI